MTSKVLPGAYKHVAALFAFILFPVVLWAGPVPVKIETVTVTAERFGKNLCRQGVESY
ncbi:MAG: hypothetical protein R6V41_03105 [Desulfobacteraceae bacterium]